MTATHAATVRASAGAGAWRKMGLSVDMASSRERRDLVRGDSGEESASLWCGRGSSLPLLTSTTTVPPVARGHSAGSGSAGQPVPTTTIPRPTTPAKQLSSGPSKLEGRARLTCSKQIKSTTRSKGTPTRYEISPRGVAADGRQDAGRLPRGETRGPRAPRGARHRSPRCSDGGPWRRRGGYGLRRECGGRCA